MVTVLFYVINVCKYVDTEKKTSKMKSGKDVVPLRLISETKNSTSKTEVSMIIDLINPILVGVIPAEELSTIVNYTMQENEMF